VRSCLCTRSPSAVSAQCQRFQRPLTSLATSATWSRSRSALAPARSPRLLATYLVLARPQFSTALCWNAD